MNIKDLEAVQRLIGPIASQIADLSSRIVHNRSAVSASETATRNQLIEPLMRALGWDTSDPELVTPEYSAGQGRVDYALMHHGNPIVLMEAKKLGTKLTAETLLQAFGYVNDGSVKYVVICNGDNWDVHRIPLTSNARMASFAVSSDPPYSAALEAAKLSRQVLIETSEAESRHGRYGQKIVVDGTIEKSIGDESQDNSTDLLSDEGETAGLAKADVRQGWLTLDDVGFRTGDPRPKVRLAFPGEKCELKIKTYKDLWIQVVEWLWRTEAQDQWKRYFHRYVGQSPSELPKTSKPFQLSNELWIKTNYQTQAIGKNITEALQRFGVDQQTIRVTFVSGGIGNRQSTASVAQSDLVPRKPSTAKGTPNQPFTPMLEDSLPHVEYEPALLRALHDEEGTARRPDAHKRVGEILRHKFGAKDLETRLSDGLFNWQYRTDWVKAKFVSNGLIDRSAPRGVWRLTDEGRKRAEATLE